MDLDLSYDGLAKAVSDVEFAILEGIFNADSMLNEFGIERGSDLAKSISYFLERAKLYFEEYQQELKSLRSYRPESHANYGSQEERNGRKNLKIEDVNSKYFGGKRNLIADTLKELNGSNGNGRNS